MAQISRIWSTDPAPAGDQQTSYSQADFADLWRGVGEGVISNHPLAAFADELVCTDGGAATVSVAAGAAIVDGVYYENTASVDLTVAAAVGVGNTRIDRIVARVTWASFDVALTVIAGTDAASPVAPAVTKTSETTYDLPLCRALVNTSGDITVTDERIYFIGQKWTTYTPTWTGVTTDPAIDDGTLSGRYCQVGKMVTVHIVMIAGAGTTFGAGYWWFGLPVASKSTGEIRYAGVFQAYDAGTTYYVGSAQIAAGGTVIDVFFRDNVNAIGLTATAPFTWNASDRLYISITYEAA